jgi:hypothetical protein
METLPLEAGSIHETQKQEKSTMTLKGTFSIRQRARIALRN